MATSPLPIDLAAIARCLGQDLAQMRARGGPIERLDDLIRLELPGATVTEVKRQIALVRRLEEQIRRQAEDQLKGQVDQIEKDLTAQQSQDDPAFVQQAPIIQEPGKFILAGRVIEQQTGLGLAHATVQIDDPDLATRLTTDSLGDFSQHYAIDQNLTEREIHITVLDGEERCLGTIKHRVSPRAGTSAPLLITIEAPEGTLGLAAATLRTLFEISADEVKQRIRSLRERYGRD